MKKKKEKIEFRYYDMPDKEFVLALFGDEWIREYGIGVEGLHFHNYMEIGVCHFGKGSLTLDDTIVDFDKGNIVIIPANIPHTTNSIKNTKAFIEWMYFDIDKILKYLFLKEELGDVEKIKRKIKEAPIYLGLNIDSKLGNIILEIMDELKNKRYMYKESIKGLLKLFIIEILRIRQYNEELIHYSREKILIAPAIEYIDKNFGTDIKISELAYECSISESHFRKKFTEYMNMKPIDYINLVRVQKACDMMLKTLYSMGEIAYQCGFGNVSSFNRNFRKILDTTPYKWKKLSSGYEGKLTNYRISAQKGW